MAGPNLDFLEQFGSPFLIAAELWNHGPAMAEAMRDNGIARPTFNDAELRDLISHLNATSQTRSEEPFYVLPGRADEGRRLFRDKGCILCHSVGGEGGRVGPDLAQRELHRSLTQFATAMWNKAPAMMKEMKARSIEVPRLQASEMADLVAYLYAVRYLAELGDRTKGRELAMTKGCLGCHSLDTRAGKVGPDLTQGEGSRLGRCRHRGALEPRLHHGGACRAPAGGLAPVPPGRDGPPRRLPANARPGSVKGRRGIGESRYGCHQDGANRCQEKYCAPPTWLSS